MTRRRAKEAGSLLIVVMIGAAVASIALAVATQAWSTTWRRDSEQELIFRGEQYVNAILAYRKEHGGQFPTRLDQLFKPGPRGLRYIRRLYKDPIAKDGKWGLLYLMPGGRGVYDPKAAQKAQDKSGGGWNQEWTTAGGPQVGNPIDPNGTGVPQSTGMIPGSLPANLLPPGLTPPQAPLLPEGEQDKDSVSEPPLGWPIVGVISRAFGKQDDHTFMIRQGHDKISEWQFHVFEKEGVPQPQANTGAPAAPRGVGPGFGGNFPIQGIGPNNGGPGIGRRNLFPPGRGMGGGQGGMQQQQQQQGTQEN